jgi:hypothetical protein
MPYPPLRAFNNADECRAYFERIYCRGPIMTFDGIAVRFRKSVFDHCFFESSNRDGVKDSFSGPRSERIDWIKEALEDATADLYQGWDKQRKRYDSGRRVCVVEANYVVVIALKSGASADFRTAFVADSGRTLGMIQRSPRWQE